MNEFSPSTCLAALRQFFHSHRRTALAILAGILWIIETCCLEIKVVHGQLLRRSCLSVDFIYLYI